MKVYLFLLLGLLTACGPTNRCRPTRQCMPADQLTVGVVQREVHIGMPASDVASILGSPNIVSLDENRDEVWVYDKISSEVEYSSRGKGVWLVIVGDQSCSGYRKRSQKTLTIVVKFDEDKRVRDFTYHSSSF